MPIELKIPQSGESITEVQIGTWRKSSGDYVDRDEIVVEIETDKASMELPAPASGAISKVLKKQGETVRVGDVIALIDDTAKRPAGSAAAPVKPQTSASPPAPATPASARTKKSESEPRVMPAARRALAESGLDVSQVTPTGPGGRVLKEDVQRASSTAAVIRPDDGRTMTGVVADRPEEAVPMTMIRRRIAERLVSAQQTAALLTTFNEIDMTSVQSLRAEYKDAFLEKYKVKLGFMSFFVKAAIDALKLVPQVNAEIRGTDIIYKNFYDIGVAVGGGKGLVVPILRSAERMSFADIEMAIADLGSRARENKIKLDELEGGTFTISNGGVYGSLLSTPIVNPPQSGILGLHAIQDRPVAAGGQVVIRPMMYIALTYDHRIVDGREAVTFLKRIKEVMEKPARMLMEI